MNPDVPAMFTLVGWELRSLQYRVEFLEAERDRVNFFGEMNAELMKMARELGGRAAELAAAIEKQSDRARVLAVDPYLHDGSSFQRPRRWFTHGMP